MVLYLDPLGISSQRHQGCGDQAWVDFAKGWESKGCSHSEVDRIWGYLRIFKDMICYGSFKDRILPTLFQAVC